MKEGKISMPNCKIFPTRTCMKQQRDKIRNNDLLWMDMLPFAQLQAAQQAASEATQMTQ